MSQSKVAYAVGIAQLRVPGTQRPKQILEISKGLHKSRKHLLGTTNLELLFA